MGPAKAPAWKRRLFRVAIILVAIYLLGFFGLLLIEDWIVFRPVKASEGWNPPPKRLTRLRDVELDCDAGKVHAWWSPPEKWDPSQGAVLYCHGNAGNLSLWGPALEAWSKHRPEAVLIFDYPGYGKSEGKPSEAGCHAAARAAYDWVCRNQKVAGQQVILVGQSLGSAVATNLATECDYRALVLISPPSSMPDMATERFPMFPLRWFIHNRFDNLQWIGQCHRPVFLAHGTADQMVAFRNAERVFAVANEPKKLYRLEGVGHDVVLDAAFFRSLREFLDKAEK
jgi:fermentation-respiration switch protein FrsA (DUF1100 family)